MKRSRIGDLVMVDAIEITGMRPSVEENMGLRIGVRSKHSTIGIDDQQETRELRNTMEVGKETDAVTDTIFNGAYVKAEGARTYLHPARKNSKAESRRQLLHRIMILNTVQSRILHVHLRELVAALGESIERNDEKDHIIMTPGETDAQPTKDLSGMTGGPLIDEGVDRTIAFSSVWALAASLSPRFGTAKNGESSEERFVRN